jgi:hypothetical protein
MLGMEVGDAYSKAIEQVLSNPVLSSAQYILTIEHDNTAPQDGVLALIRQMELHPEFDAISGLYWTKGPLGVPQIWGDPKDCVGVNFRPQPPRGGVQECNGIGMGFALWRMDLFKDVRLRRPWFRTTQSMQEGGFTQDLYAWTDFKKHGHRCAVDNDVKCGHYDSKEDILW